jgi:hypothetical protein
LPSEAREPTCTDATGSTWRSSATGSHSSLQALYHPQRELNPRLRNFDLEVLDVVDVVVSKLKRFHADDRADIEAMVDLELVPHARLVARFREAVDIFLGDARAEDLPRYWRNLNTVERDFLRVPETEVDLPEYINR